MWLPVEDVQALPTELSAIKISSIMALDVVFGSHIFEAEGKQTYFLVSFLGFHLLGTNGVLVYSLHGLVLDVWRENCIYAPRLFQSHSEALFLHLRAPGMTFWHGSNATLCSFNVRSSLPLQDVSLSQSLVRDGI